MATGNPVKSLRSRCKPILTNAKTIEALQRFGISTSKYYSLSTGITVVKTLMTILYRLSTSFAVIKTVLVNICRSSTSFVGFKTSMPNFYRPSTGFGEVEQANFDYCIPC